MGEEWTISKLPGTKKPLPSLKELGRKPACSAIPKKTALLLIIRLICPKSNIGSQRVIFLTAVKKGLSNF
jgi:hypothetical protein